MPINIYLLWLINLFVKELWLGAKFKYKALSFTLNSDEKHTFLVPVCFLQNVLAQFYKI